MPFVSKGGRRNSGVVRTLTEGLPSIEVIVPAYLEESTIGPTVARLREQLSIWSGSALVTVIASDAGTARAAEAADNVILTQPQGKPSAVNYGVNQSRADIICLTDGNTSLEPFTWSLLTLKELENSELLSANKKETGGQEGVFWKFEEKAKRHSSRTSGSLSVVGEFLAFRRSDFRDIPANTQSDDLWIAMDFDARGLRSTICDEITAHEVAATPKDQWERRIRIAAGQLFEALPKTGQLFRSAAGRSYLAHKMYRLTIGVAAFWGAAILGVMIFPPLLGPLSLIIVVASVLHYRGYFRLPGPLGIMGVVVGMQVIPILGGVRALRRYLRGRKGQTSAGWTKVAR